MYPYIYIGNWSHPLAAMFSTYQKYLDIFGSASPIYAKSFSNPSVSISQDAMGLSAVCDCGIS